MPGYSLWQRAVRRLSLLPMIVLTAFAVGAPSSPASVKRVALVVSINQYENLDAAQQLQKAVGDSHAVGKALRPLGYEETALHSRKGCDPTQRTGNAPCPRAAQGDQDSQAGENA